MEYRNLHHQTLGSILFISVIIFNSFERCLTSVTCGDIKMNDLNLKQFFIPDISNSNEPEKLYYRYLKIDESSSSLFVGAMNYVIRLNLRNISNLYQNRKLFIDPQKNEVRYCSLEAKPQVPDCQNHVRYIGRYKTSDANEIYICGTNALVPKGYTIAIDSMSRVGQSSNAETICPSDAFRGSTAVFVESGNPGNKAALYTGTSSTNRAFIYRPPLVGNMDYMNSGDDPNWLNDANFVGSFDVDDSVYFFFREVAMEFINCEKRIFSRVAKVCKKDLGGSGSILYKRWTSFQKARLNCSIPGSFPAYFDEIQDVYQVNNTFYGLFTTNVNGISASAICAFSLQSINKAFSGKFKSQKDATSIWLPVTQSEEPTWIERPPRCTSDTKSLGAKTLSFIRSTPLMDEAVQPMEGRPLFYETTTQMTRLEAAHNINQNNELVFFASTSNGKIYKIFLHKKQNSLSVLSSIYSLFDEQQTIWSLKLLNESLYAGTDTMVKQMNVKTCHHYYKIDTCAYDPYCAWERVPGICKEMQPDYLSQPNIYFTYKNIGTITTDNQEKLYTTSTRRRNISSTVVMEINYKLCTANKQIKWKYKGDNSVVYSDVMLDNDSFRLTDNNALIIDNIKLEHSGNYTAVATIDDAEVVLAEHSLTVFKDNEHIEREWTKQFEEWCDFFDEQKRLQKQWIRTCGSG